MSLNGEISIVSGCSVDAQGCWKLANSVALVRGCGSSSQGFLIGTESADDYLQMFTEGVSLVAHDSNGQILGFVIGYHKGSKPFREIFTEDRVETLKLQSLLSTRAVFHVDKICVASEVRRLGLANRIYNRLFSDLSSSITILAFIVEHPNDNVASRHFHLSHGFTKIASLSISQLGPLQDVVEGLWIRNPCLRSP
jgi:hypothetical protein